MEHEVGENKRWVVGDATEVLSRYDSEAAVVVLDDAWAFPSRITRFDNEFTTHPFDESHADVNSQLNVDYSTTSVELIDACYDALQDGGWLIADAEDWYLPYLVDYLKREWGDAAQTDDGYDGGGYRRTGGVTYLDEAGEPERNPDRRYLSSGGYSVVFAHKGPTDRHTSVAARQLAVRPADCCGESVKPVSPYRAWLAELMEPGELLLVPCAGSGPAAIAAEQVVDRVRYTCVDTDETWYDGFRKRRAELVE